MSKPIIGINCNIRPHEGVEGNLNVDMLYAEAVYRAGGIPQIIPYLKNQHAIDEMIDLIDGLLMTGGGGLLPAVQNLDVLPGLEKQNPTRHPYDLDLIKAAINKKIPILGVCRGHQTINDAFGGTIENIGDTTHLQKQPAKESLHQIKIEPQTILGRAINSDVAHVNSFHRQSISTLGKGLKVSAYATDGRIEAIESTVYPFILGVQFHPEFMLHDSRMLSIYQSFVQSARDGKM